MSGAFTLPDPNAGGVAVDVEGNVAHDSPDAGNPVKVGGHANAGQRAAVGEDDRVDASYTLNGSARVAASDDVVAGAGGAWTQLAPGLGDASSRRVIKASPGCLRRLKIVNLSTSALWIYICNGTAVGDVTFANLIEVPTPIQAGGTGAGGGQAFVEISFEQGRLVGAAGLVVGLSTNNAAYTAPGAPTNALFVSAQYA